MRTMVIIVDVPYSRRGPAGIPARYTYSGEIDMSEIVACIDYAYLDGGLGFDLLSGSRERGGKRGHMHIES